MVTRKVRLGLRTVALTKSKRIAGEGEASGIIEGGDPNTSASRQPPRSRGIYITSEGHTRKIFGPALEGKRHLTDEVIAAIAEKISSK